MKLFIHDLEIKDFKKLFSNSLDESIIISNNGMIHHCMGCFGCWIKTPGACVIRDEYGDIGKSLSKSNEVIIISKCYYGGFSPFIKNVLDRSIPYIHPYFVIRQGEMHHRRRYENHKEKDIIVYSLVNCGFYEGHQNKLAIEMMENWCTKAGLKWGQGIGIGAGGMLLGIKNVPIGHGPKKNLGKALKQLANNILKSSSEENIFITANFPRVLYKLAAEMGWRQSIKANGLKRKDLSLRK